MKKYMDPVLQRDDDTDTNLDYFATLAMTKNTKKGFCEEKTLFCIFIQHSLFTSYPSHSSSSSKKHPE